MPRTNDMAMPVRVDRVGWDASRRQARDLQLAVWFPVRLCVGSGESGRDGVEFVRCSWRLQARQQADARGRYCGVRDRRPFEAAARKRTNGLWNG